MNTKVLLSVVLSISLLFSACKKDDDETPKPVVTIKELGQGESHSNDLKATIGGSLHMDVEIVAEGKVDYVQVKLHHGDHKSALDDDEWEIDSTFRGDGITGLKNLDFHKDLLIDTAAEPGEYHFEVIAVDMEGNSGKDEKHLDLEEPAIKVTSLSINGDNHDVSKGSGSLNITFTATAKTGKTLKKYSIEIHNHPPAGQDEDKIIDETFTVDFAGKNSATVNKNIDIDQNLPTGEYHVEIIITDSDDNTTVVSGHLDLED